MLYIVEKMCFVVLISCDLWNFSTQKINFPVRRFCTGTVYTWCIHWLLFRYPPILHLIPWTWSRQPGELSKHLFLHNLQCNCTVSCELGGSKISSRACHSISIVTFSSTPLITGRKNPDCRLPAVSTYWEPCVSIYCTWLLYGLQYLKKLVDNYFYNILFFRNYFVVDFIVTILIMMKIPLCQTARTPLLPFLSQRGIGLPIMRRPLPSLAILCRVKWKRFTKKPGVDKRELDWSKKPKVLVAIDKIKELFPETCRACGGAISLKQTMSGAVLTLQWNCDSGHFGTWASILRCSYCKNNQKV